MTTHAHIPAAELDRITRDEHVEHAHVHHESFLTKYFFSRDHKRIGVQFLLSSLLFFLVGGLLAMAVRWHLAYPHGNFPMHWLMPKSFLAKAPALPTEWTQGWEVKLNE